MRLWSAPAMTGNSCAMEGHKVGGSARAYFAEIHCKGWTSVLRFATTTGIFCTVHGHKVGDSAKAGFCCKGWMSVLRLAIEWSLV
mmetsp:Transcript_8834/g.18275  ORF Transcript_8834/g.18275 Transcript_8834/m.18275 type:complete len:85 (+) Transcript_8834:96-350(+)